MSRRTLLLLAAIVATFAVLGLGAGADQPAAKVGLLGKFKEGQPLVVIEKDGRYEIRPIADAAARTHSIVEVGSDFLLLLDLGEQIETVIPVYSIKSVVTLKDLNAKG